jgi:hypothetical protein
MEHDVLEVRARGGRRLWLRFRDGERGEVDVGALVRFSGVFAPLGDESYFARVEVNPETFTVTWPNGADLDSDVLYALATGKRDSLPGASNAK